MLTSRSAAGQRALLSSLVSQAGAEMLPAATLHLRETVLSLSSFLCVCAHVCMWERLRVHVYTRVHVCACVLCTVCAHASVRECASVRVCASARLRLTLLPAGC